MEVDTDYSERMKEVKVSLTNRVEVKWMASAEGKETLKQINEVYQKATVTSELLTAEPSYWQERSGIGDCRKLQWVFEHWHCLHVYSDVIHMLEVVNTDHSQSKNDEKSSSTGVAATAVTNQVNPKRQLVDGEQAVRIYQTRFPSWRDKDAAQRLSEELWNFLESMMRKESVAIPKFVDKCECSATAVAEIVISTALQFFLDHPDCGDIMTLCILPENAEILEAFTNVQNKIKLGAMQAFQEVSFMTLTFNGCETAVDQAVKLYKKELSYAIVSADWRDSPLSDGIQLLTTKQIVELETLATERNTDIYISKPEKVIRLLGLRSDVEKLRGIIDKGLFARISQSLTRDHTDQIPNHWDEGFYEVDLHSSTEEYQNVLDTVYSSPEVKELFEAHNFQITKITRIQNSELHRQYEAQKVKVIQSLGDEIHKFPAERMLWHVANPGFARYICDQGFNREYWEGWNLGQGLTFTVEIFKYRCKMTAGSCLFLARVLTGRYHQGQQSTNRTNLMPTYHSTADSCLNPQTFKVYHDASAYPQYMIEYTV